MSSVPVLPDILLSDLVAEFADANTIGVLLAGSHARGDATPHSDIDLIRFAAVLPEAEADRYALAYREGHLVSFSITTIDAKRNELSQPETAIWAVPGLRQARILLDRDGALAALLGEAHAFRWEPLQAEADAYASYNVMGLAEEVHKVLGALAKGDEAVALYGTWGLVAGLLRAMIVQRGVLIRTENSYFQQAQEAAGLDSAWSRAFRVAMGLEMARAVARATAALRLYQETATLLAPALQRLHLDVIRGALARIDASDLVREGDGGI
jgi:hypothetical protein